MVLKTLAILAFSSTLWANAPGESKVNKLLYMYRFFYLPFSLEFREGKTINDILPFIAEEGALDKRLVRAEELQALDKEWEQIRAGWRKKTLLLSTEVPLGKSTRITNRLVSHHIPLTRSWNDAIDLNERIQLADMLKAKSAIVQGAFKQLRFIKSFLAPADEGRFNFFVVSAHWCESCREYRVLLETYFKNFPKADVVLHSVVVEDPKENIFDSRLLKELFPNPGHYTHESIPRFLAYENTKTGTSIWEEGEALKELYEKFKDNRGFLDAKVALFAKKNRTLSSDPK